MAWEPVATTVVTVHGRFDDVHRRIDHLWADMNAGFAQVDGRLSELREDVRKIRTLLQEVLRARMS